MNSFKLLNIIVILLTFQFASQLTAQNNQTYSVNAVYFFGPSAAELDTLNENYLDAIDDFNNYTNKVVPFLKHNNIKTEYLFDRIIEIKYDIDLSIIVNRDSINFGTILTDGRNKPKILKYVLTDDVLMEDIKAYFKIN